VVALIKVGFSETMALSLSRQERVAILIVSGEIDGAEFDWSVGQWRERK
jgi:hypothetical protein